MPAAYRLGLHPAVSVGDEGRALGRERLRLGQRRVQMDAQVQHVGDIVGRHLQGSALGPQARDGDIEDGTHESPFNLPNMNIVPV